MEYSYKGKLVPLETNVVKLRTGTHHRQRYSNQHDYKAKVPMIAIDGIFVIPVTSHRNNSLWILKQVQYNKVKASGYSWTMYFHLLAL